MASTDARKKVIESLRGGMMVVPWIEKKHFTLVVGYATTGDHMHCFHIDSLATPRSDSFATPRSSILERFIEATRKETPTISITPVAINTGLQTGGLDCSLWVLAAAEFAMQWQPVRPQGPVGPDPASIPTDVQIPLRPVSTSSSSSEDLAAR